MEKLFSDYYIPGIGQLSRELGLIPLRACSDGVHVVGKNGVQSVTTTGDGKVEFIDNGEMVLAYVKSEMGYPAYYPLSPAKIKRPVKAVLMDLDGTTVRSEDFWMWIIELTVSDLLGDPGFQLEAEDVSYVSGHSVSEHLQYCINKYCPGKSIVQARDFYHKNTRREMSEISKGGGRKDAFTPADGIRDFLLELKNRDIKIGLVTSGLYEKAWPEILSAFKTLDMGDPLDFYDSIITAGIQPGDGVAGTLGELEAKPHPWLYAEAARVGLGMGPDERHHVVGIEDSGAGIASIRLAGFAAIGIRGGNILESGTRPLCNHYCQSFEEILKTL
jgi:beta-phosphoglucomutase-like phosphatase (HAD superfamily)